MMDASPNSQTFRLARRGQYIGQAVIFLVFSASCFIQVFIRFPLPIDKFWNSWWFFLILGLGFGYLTVESAYKAFYTRLVFNQDGFTHYDFLKVTRLRWEQVKMVGEVDLKFRNRKDYGLFLKDTAIENPNILSMPFISLLPFMVKWSEDPIMVWLKQHQHHLLKK